MGYLPQILWFAADHQVAGFCFFEKPNAGFEKRGFFSASVVCADSNRAVAVDFQFKNCAPVIYLFWIRGIQNKELEVVELFVG